MTPTAAVYPPGPYTLTLTLQLPAAVARELGYPEEATYDGDTAVRTFGPLGIRTESPQTLNGLVTGFAVALVPDLADQPYQVIDATLTPGHTNL